ncbi:hypothetical protein [Clostridium lacusfryxellense]|uniref:hypothetical protein n=1 Tax=Clostridium lacusfryxellense TaxID=205328 RepID=UPI001C0BB4D1|nr:hypothetical protein [Clostridium lacusfryxellense]MBU3112938.1 hypothetical protein [Clostridium lacusfryxellense]
MIGELLISFLKDGNLIMLNIPPRYRITTTIVEVMEPFNPRCSSDNGWAIIFPITEAITKSRSLNCEIVRCPKTFATVSKKKKAIIARRIHSMVVSVSWPCKKSI